MKGPVVVPLQRRGVRQQSSEQEASSFFVGKVAVGLPPQVLEVVFDTSSGDVMLPHRACGNLTCREHRRYSPWESVSAMDIDADGGLVEGVGRGQRMARGSHKRDFVTVEFSQSDLGEGKVEAVIVRDTVCVGGGTGGAASSNGSKAACVDMALLAATSMDEKPFRAMPSDGIIGLGMQGLASGPLSSFVGRLFAGSSNVVPQFGIAYGVDHGEVHFGGHGSARLAAPLSWFPVDHPEQGFWQVAIQAVRVGNTTVDGCQGGCHAIVDTGVSRLGVQASRMSAVRDALSSVMGTRGGECAGPDLTFDLGGMMLHLQAQDYAAGEDCQLQLGALDLEEPKFVGVYAFGESMLRRYYAAFDWEQRKLGFAPLVRDIDDNARSRSHPLPETLLGTLMI